MIFGTFDGVHEGHRNLFRQAKGYGDFLIAVVARDETVLRVKGRRSKYPECARYAALFAEKEIDEAVLGDLRDRYAAIKKYKPEVICLGYDQERFVEGLREIFFGEIVRLSSFQPEVFKSSKMSKDENFVANAKKAMRNRFLRRRKEFPKELQKTESEIMLEKLFRLPEVRSAKTIAVYRPIEGEPDIRPLFDRFREEKKTILVPLSRDRVAFAVATDRTRYKRVGGIEIPAGGAAFEGRIDAAIVPCIAFDDAGNRLGSGSGWYDRFLAEHPETVSIGVGFSVQRVACVPAEKHDRKMFQLCTA